MGGISLGPRPKTNPSADCFQYHAWGVIPEAIYAPDEVWMYFMYLQHCYLGDGRFQHVQENGELFKVSGFASQFFNIC